MIDRTEQEMHPIPDSAKNDRIGANTDSEYRIGASLITK